MLRSSLLLTLLLLLSGHTYGNDTKFWFGGSGGVSTEGTAVAGNFSLVVKPGIMFTLTFDHSWDSQGSSGFHLFSDERHTESFSDLGFMVGYLHNFSDSSDGSISVQLGVADASITRNGEYIEDTFFFGPYWEKLEFNRTSLLVSCQFHYRRFYVEFRNSSNSFESMMGMLFGYRVGNF